MSIYKVNRNSEKDETLKFLSYLEISIDDEQVIVSTVDKLNAIITEGLENMPNLTLKLNGTRYAFNLLPNEDTEGVRNNHSSSRFKCVDKKGGLLSTRSIVFNNENGALKAAASVYLKPNTNDKTTFDIDNASDDHIRLVTAYINDNANIVKDYIEGNIGYDDIKRNVSEFNDLSNRDKLKMMKKVKLIKK